MSQCGSVASILTLTVSCTAFIVVLQRLEEIEQRLKGIEHKIDLSFYADFRANLKYAQNAFTGKIMITAERLNPGCFGVEHSSSDLQRLHSYSI
ncbi:MULTISPECIES: hypothetical protein [unclassified Microcoleus]|uniref:hypothetical protein n=1 Tax=unclassified Microcoleus TaxID=2642155 RepID=UPI002FD63E4C